MAARCNFLFSAARRPPRDSLLHVPAPAGAAARAITGRQTENGSPAGLAAQPTGARGAATPSRPGPAPAPAATLRPRPTVELPASATGSGLNPSGVACPDEVSGGTVQTDGRQASAEQAGAGGSLWTPVEACGHRWTEVDNRK